MKVERVGYKGKKALFYYKYFFFKKKKDGVVVSVHLCFRASYFVSLLPKRDNTSWNLFVFKIS